MAGRSSGVEVRPNSIRIRLQAQGVSVVETVMVNGVPLAPTPANLKYAHRLAADIRHRINLGTFNLAEFFPHSKKSSVQEGALLLGNLLDDWLKSKGSLTEATRDQYATAVRFWKQLLGADTKVADLTHKVLASKIGSYPWPSAKTHNNYLIALRGSFGLEFRGETAAKNPTTGLQNLKALKKLPDPLTAAERDKVLADMRKHYPVQVFAYFLWQFYTGMRPEETIALRWSDVDRIHGTVRVQRVRTFRGGERDGSKTHTVRDVDLLPQALEALALMRPITSMLRSERDDGDPSADIFQHPVTGKAWHDERAQRDTYWRPSLKRAGVRWRSAYSTRHTFATSALMTGVVPPAYIAAQLGHSLKVLLERYARWIPGGDGGSARVALAAALKAESAPDLPQTFFGT